MNQSELPWAPNELAYQTSWINLSYHEPQMSYHQPLWPTMSHHEPTWSIMSHHDSSWAAMSSTELPWAPKTTINPHELPWAIISQLQWYDELSWEMRPKLSCEVSSPTMSLHEPVAMYMSSAESWAPPWATELIYILKHNWSLPLTSFQMPNSNQSQYINVGLLIIKVLKAPLHHIPRYHEPAILTNKLTLTSQQQQLEYPVQLQ